MISLLQYISEKFNNAKQSDEFYTRLQDIEAGASMYDFSNKVVYCCCDNPKFSNFWKYFHDNYSKLKLKGLIATYYDDDPLRYDYDGKDIKKTKINSGRFQDNYDIFKEADIIVTNPPFSDGMPTELLSELVRQNKDFLIVGPLGLIVNKKAFQLIKDNKVFAGTKTINRFSRPDGSTKTAACCWWQSWDDQHEKFEFTKEYNDNDYQKYDNYDAIDCKTYKNIPKNYKGNIGTSYRFITHLNRKEFDIIDIIAPKLNGVKVMTKLIVKQK